MELRSIVLALSLALMASAAQAQTTPPVPGVKLGALQGTVPGNVGNVVACVPGNTFATARGDAPCLFVVDAPLDSTLVCVEILNSKTRNLVPVNAVFGQNAQGETCIPAISGQRLAVSISRPVVGEGSIVALARARKTNSTVEALPGLLLVPDVSFARAIDLLVCPLEAFGVPIAGCPRSGNDIASGEFPDLFPGQ